MGRVQLLTQTRIERRLAALFEARGGHVGPLEITAACREEIERVDHVVPDPQPGVTLEAAVRQLARAAEMIEGMDC